MGASMIEEGWAALHAGDADAARDHLEQVLQHAESGAARCPITASRLTCARAFGHPLNAKATQHLVQLRCNDSDAIRLPRPTPE